MQLDPFASFRLDTKGCISWELDPFASFIHRDGEREGERGERERERERDRERERERERDREREREGEREGERERESKVLLTFSERDAMVAVEEGRDLDICADAISFSNT